MYSSKFAHMNSTISSEHLLADMERAIDLFESKKLKSAERICLKLVKANPANAEVLHLYGCIANAQDRLNKARRLFEQACDIDDTSEFLNYNFGLVLEKLGQIDQAEIKFRRALELCETYADAHLNLGMLFENSGRFEDAESCYRRAINVAPSFAEAHFSLGRLLLRNGSFEEGWAAYQFRFFARSTDKRPSNILGWKGESLKGKSILLYHEQGLGDTIQFMRFAPILSDMGAQVILEVQPSLVPLAQSLRGSIRVVANSSKLPDHDFGDLYI